MKYHDISNSFKIYRSELLKQASLECDNFDIVEELLYKLHSDNPNLKTLEIPYSFKKRMFGKTKRNLPVFVMTFAVTLLKLIWGKLNFILMMKYFFVALLGLMIDYSIYLFLLKIVKLHYFSAGFISFCFGFIINYIAGRKYVFTKGSVFKQARFEFIAVLSIQLLAIGIHQFSLYAAVDLLNIPPVYGKLVALSVTFFWNFIGRHFVYHTGH